MRNFDNLGEPWYPCEGCRALCCRNLYPVLETLRELRQRFPGSKKELTFPFQVLSNGQCEMLDTETWRCKDYEHRPLICSTIGFWKFLKGTGLYSGSLLDLRNEGLECGCGGENWNKERNQWISEQGDNDNNKE